MARAKSRIVAEFGDFQTPLPLAEQVCSMLAGQQLNPASVLEPTCGLGNFLEAAQQHFPNVRRMVGLDINPVYVERAKQRLPECEVSVASFFELDWPRFLDGLPAPLLVIGNPPWVTNSELGTLNSTNLPAKQNFQNHKGLDALTGKSNFDISEWMLMYLMEWLAERDAALAVLCKTAVARKVLHYAWKRRLSISSSEIHAIDAARHFNVAVDACLFLCRFSRFEQKQEWTCKVHHDLGSKPNGSLGFLDGKIIADAEAYRDLKHLEGESLYRWRSGIKHDCGKVMEFQRKEGRLINGHGEAVDIEDRYLFPLLKSSALLPGRSERPDRWMLVTQKSVGEETRTIEQTAPRTWKYLLSHADSLDQRKSSIYKNRPRFSVFGVGKYTFAPWKVAISGFYKRLEFVKLGPFEEKPIVLDDTAYFLDCHSEQEADIVCCLLNSAVARRFFSAFIFWDAKRPITASILKLLDIQKLAKCSNQWEELKASRAESPASQLSLF